MILLDKKEESATKVRRLRILGYSLPDWASINMLLSVTV
jgi:hypothetical protein